MGGVGLQQHESLAARVTGLLVHVQLEVLVVEQETSSGFVDGQVLGILLVQQIGVVAVVQGSLHLYHLTRNLFSDGVNVRPLPFPASLPESALCGLGWSL